MKAFDLRFLISVTVVFLLSSCGSKTGQDAILRDEIKKMEEVFASNAVSVEQKSAFDLLGKYELYVSKYPNDTTAPGYLFKAGELAMAIKAPKQALFYLQKLQNNYPNHRQVSYSIFLQAFIYETQVNDLAKAREYYELFISKYPNHQLVGDARASIEMLGKDLDEIIKGFEKNNNPEK